MFHILQQGEPKENDYARAKSFVLGVGVVFTAMGLMTEQAFQSYLQQFGLTN